MHGCAKYQSHFVIASRDTAEVLQPAPHILNRVPVAIMLFVETILPFPITPVRNDRFCPLSLWLLPQFGAVISLVSKEDFGWFRFFNQFHADRTVMRLSACQHKTQKTPLGIGDPVNFGIASATRAADRLVFLSTFAARGLTMCLDVG